MRGIHYRSTTLALGKTPVLGMLSVLACGCAAWVLLAPQTVIATIESSSMAVTAPDGPAYPIRIAMRGANYTGRNLEYPGYPIRLSFLPERHVTVPANPDVAERHQEEATPVSDQGEGVTTEPAARAGALPISGRTSFASAFADLFRREPEHKPVMIGGIKLLASDFNLAKADALGSALEISKPVHADGARKGEVALRIVNDTTILIDSEVVAGLLDDEANRAKVASLARNSSSGRFIEFNSLRSAGIDVRYDPIRDIVVLSSRQS